MYLHKPKKPKENRKSIIVSQPHLRVRVKARTQQHQRTDTDGPPTVVSPRVSSSWPCVALEHTAKTSADGQEARMNCACVSGNNSPYQQTAVVCIRHSKEATTGRQTV